MGTVSAAVPRARSLRPRSGLIVAALCVAAAASYVWMRAGVAADLHAPFAHWCSDRLEPGDWQCRLSAADFLWTYAGGSLLIGLGLAVPGVVLAATGRRISALVPAAVAAGGALAITVIALPGGSNQLFGIGETILGSGEGDSFWRVHAQATILVDLLLVSVPSLAIVLFVRPAGRRPPSDLPRHAVWASTIAIGGAIAAFRILWPDLQHEQYLSAPLDDVAASVIVMALFGSMLGTDRRWWPWALVPAASLLSLGPATAVMSIPSSLTAFTWFADALPLAVVGLVASLWRPLATRFARRRVAPAPSAVATSPTRVRPSVVLNAVAGGLVIVGVIAARMDPLPIQISTPLPTYLGARVLVQDVRVKMNPVGGDRSDAGLTARAAGRTAGSTRRPARSSPPSSRGATPRRARSSSCASRRCRKPRDSSSRAAAAEARSARRPRGPEPLSAGTNAGA
jgi:hypothetical protein